MSYIVPDKIPSYCAECDWSICLYPNAYCKRVHKTSELLMAIEKRPDWCPLVEIKTPHGRIIDADAHILEIRKQYCEDCSRRKGIKNGKMQFCYEIGGVVCRACEIEDMLNALDDAPTVIEEEGQICN